jgi:hypothetical protein
VIGISCAVRWLIALALAACSASRHDGTVALCAPDDIDVGWILAIHSDDGDTDSPAARRIGIPVNVATGARGAAVSLGENVACLGPAGQHVIIKSWTGGVQLRDPKSGAIVATQAQLVGSGSAANPYYRRSTHSLEFDDAKGVRVAIDPITREKRVAYDTTTSVAEGTAAITPYLPELARGSLGNAFYGSGDPRYKRAVTVGRYGLACFGEACRLGTRDIDVYGNGTSLTEIPDADVLENGAIFLVPSIGVLVVEKHATLVGFDGKQRWQRPGFDAWSGWIVDHYVLMSTREFGNGTLNNAGKVTVRLIDITTGAVSWTEDFDAGSNSWDSELAVAAVRSKDAIIIGANAKLVAMPIGPGKQRW